MRTDRRGNSVCIEDQECKTSALLVLPVLSGRMAHGFLEHAMKLGIAAESRLECRLEHRDPLAGAVQLQESFDPLAVAEVDQRGSRLLFEQSAEAVRA